jgi:hypothetical protein
MAITFQSSTIANRAGGNILGVAWPSSIAAGDLIIAAIQGIANSWNITSFGFTACGASTQNQGGSNREVELYYKVATGSESGTLTITAGGGNAWSIALLRYTNATGAWSVADTNGNATTATSHSIAGGADPGIDSGDHVIVATTCGTSSGNANAGGASAQALSATGCTFTNENEVYDGLNTSGSDHYYILSRHECNGGPSSSVPTYSFTIVNTQMATMAMVRIRESAGVSFTLRMPLMGVGF